MEVITERGLLFKQMFYEIMVYIYNGLIIIMCNLLVSRQEVVARGGGIKWGGSKGKDRERKSQRGS